MQGKELYFYDINTKNEEHLLILSEINKETSYLGNLTNYNFSNSGKGITGKNYLVNHKGLIIGYVVLSEEIDTSIGKVTSIYYAVLQKYYGQGYGCLILDEITEILKNNTLIDYVIANVDQQNTFGIRTIERANFHHMLEFSDEEENQYHKNLR